jgi:hypothetical protein
MVLRCCDTGSPSGHSFARVSAGAVIGNVPKPPKPWPHPVPRPAPPEPPTVPLPDPNPRRRFRRCRQPAATGGWPAVCSNDFEVFIMIRKLSSGLYRLYSSKRDAKTGRRRNLGTFRTRAAAEQRERAVQFFKRRG